MRILTNLTHDFGLHDSGCDFAIVTINEEMARKIAARRVLLAKLFQQDPELECLRYRSDSASFFRAGIVEDDEDDSGKFVVMLEELDCSGDGYIELPDNMSIAFLEDGHREGVSNELKVFMNCFCFTFYSDDAATETFLLSYNVLSKLI